MVFFLSLLRADLLINWNTCCSSSMYRWQTSKQIYQQELDCSLFMAVSRLCPLALAFSVALIIAVSTVYTFISGYSEDLVFQFKRSRGPSKRHSRLDEKMEFPYQNIRIPNHVRPLSYDINIHPNLTTFEFTGRVIINIRCFQPTRNILFHVRDLRVSNAKLTNSKQKRLKIARTVQYKKNQQHLIIVNEELREKDRYALYMEFNGTLSKNTEGFYRSSYKTKTGQVRLELPSYSSNNLWLKIWKEDE